MPWWRIIMLQTLVGLRHASVFHFWFFVFYFLFLNFKFFVFNFLAFHLRKSASKSNIICCQTESADKGCDSKVD